MSSPDERPEESGAAPAGDATAPAPAAPPPAPVDDTMKLLSGVWRVATGGDAPTLLQLIQGARVRRVDVDSVAGYVAVVADDDTHRAMGVRPEWVVRLVAALTGRALQEIAALLAKGPARIEPRPPGESA